MNMSKCGTKKKLFDKSTIDLNQYKPAQMQRRITNLMARHGVKTYVEWFNKINTRNYLSHWCTRYTLFTLLAELYQRAITNFCDTF